MSPDPKVQERAIDDAALSWREILQHGAEFAQIDGFPLERLIDLQRGRTARLGEG
jgi:hypothetical protein